MSQIENSGRLEGWKSGRVRVITSFHPSILPSLRHSTAPLLRSHSSILPAFQYSITPLLHYSTPSFPSLLLRYNEDNVPQVQIKVPVQKSHFSQASIQVALLRFQTKNDVRHRINGAIDTLSS